MRKVRINKAEFFNLTNQTENAKYSVDYHKNGRYEIPPNKQPDPKNHKKTNERISPRGSGDHDDLGEKIGASDGSERADHGGDGVTNEDAGLDVELF